MNDRQKTGSRGEKRAAAYLKKQGYRIICMNHRSPLGEVDIIASKEQTVVFCEVKARADQSYGLGREAVGRTRMQRYRNAASEFLKSHGLHGASVRFDVIELCGEDITHIQGAF